jgi:hypothetical protein
MKVDEACKIYWIVYMFLQQFFEGKGTISGILRDSLSSDGRGPLFHVWRNKTLICMAGSVLCVCENFATWARTV